MQRERNELQTEAVKTLSQNKRLILGWGTGVGKSRVAVRSCNGCIRHNKTKILLLVAETAHKENWRNEFIEALGPGGGEVFDSITVECYASLKKYQGTSWDLIVADEAHHLRSEDRTDYIATMKAGYFLCLSATMSDNRDGDILIRTLEETYGPFARLNFGIQEAIDNGILHEPAIYVHKLPLERMTKQTEITVGWGKTFLQRGSNEIYCDATAYKLYFENKNKERRYENLKLHITCSFREAYEILSEQVDDAKAEYDSLDQECFKLAATLNRGGLPGFGLTLTQKNQLDKDLKAARKEKEYAKNRWLQNGSKRKILLGQMKTPYAKYLIDKRLGNKKFVCFCSDVEQGKFLGGDNVIHSKRKGNDKVIENFNNGAINSIFAVNMIQEGQNLNGIQAGLVIQLGGKERVFIQKFGRALRSKTPEQHIIIIDDTRDLKYYETAINGIKNKYITVINVK